ncbi:MAG: redoxin family protein [Oceanospirillum sp.]|nr:redoxin family protein [Oceanospirillum sp.]
MDAVSLGPFMLSAKAIYLIASVVLFFIGAELLQWFWRRHEPDTRLSFTHWAQNCLWMGLISGRLTYVLLHIDSYRHDPLSILYFWQPGYSLNAVFLATVAVSLWHFRALKPLAVGLGWLTLSVSIWFGLSFFSPLSQPQERTIPQLTLPLLQQNGDVAQALTLDQQQGAVILNLWASWCGPCRREMPSLVRFAEDHPEVQLWLVNQGESPQMVRRFIENQLNGSNDEPIPEKLILLDPNQSLMQAIEGVGLPITLAYKNGRLIDSHIGEVNHARLREMAEAIRTDLPREP